MKVILYVWLVIFVVIIGVLHVLLLPSTIVEGINLGEGSMKVKLEAYKTKFYCEVQNLVDGRFTYATL